MNVTEETLPPYSSVIAVVSLLPCFFFLYVNIVMMFSLLRKPVFFESPRYVLFGHLLFIESLQLTTTVLLYAFNVSLVTLLSPVCVTIILLGSVSLQMSPLNLTLMSLERYVAICFPLRHASIATPRATAAAISVMWVLSSLNPVTEFFLFFTLEDTGLRLQMCSKTRVFRLQIYLTLNRAFIILYFVLASIIIIYTYIAVLVTVKSASSNARKAHKTVLLHLFQLCLCLIATLFSMINSGGSKQQAYRQYLLFICLLVLPKFLSPLIYGLRDPAFSIVFKYYFTFGLKTTVRPSSKTDVLNSED